MSDIRSQEADRRITVERMEDAAIGARAMRKATVRLIPFMFLLYIVAYLDRINISFAALQMNGDLHLSPRAYGWISGIFFLGYFTFEVPSNMIMRRVGARLWIARILVTWGLVACSMMFARGVASLLGLRFLLGVAEAGFFPGMILYLTYWFPSEERARAVARFMVATVIAGVIGSPISGWLMTWSGVGGLRGWQWIYLMEGIPAIVLGGVTLLYLTDGPEHAKWLLPEERDWIRRRLDFEQEARRLQSRHTLKEALANGQVWVLCLLYFAMVTSGYGVSLWLPQVLKQLSGFSNLEAQLLSAVPYLAAATAMVGVATHSDRTDERAKHIALSALVGGAGLTLAAVARGPWESLLAISLAMVGMSGALGPFWTLPTRFLTGAAAAGGIAWINSVGNLGGFAGPMIVGQIKSRTGSFTGGFLALAAMLLVASVVAISMSGPRSAE